MSFSEDDFLDELKKDFLNEITFDLDQAEESYMKLYTIASNIPCKPSLVEEAPPIPF